MNKIIKSVLILIYISNYILLISTNGCIPRDFGYDGTVCVCNETYCDNIKPINKLDNGQYVTYISNRQGLRFHQNIARFHNNSANVEVTIKIDSKTKYQTIAGFGGAFTDSAGININSLKEPVRDYLMKSYFSDDGIEYSLGRVPIGGTDFSTRPYTYDDFPGDENLEKFNLTEEDLTLKIPIIKEALSLRNNKLQFLASAWSAPAWMKTNNALSGVGFLYKKYYQKWADYFIKFLESYEKHNISFWGITTGNEPINGLIPFIKINSMGWTPLLMINWITNNLGPTIRNSKYKNLKIFILDDQRFFLPWYPDILFGNALTRNYTDGVAVHWYWDQFTSPSLLDKVHNKFPEKDILYSEACVGDKFYEKKVKLGSWERGEMYAKDIIENMNHWVTGWLDWNLALNMKGGPTYIDNFVDSPIIVNAAAQEFYKNPMYYTLGHFSKFVIPQSKRIKFNKNSHAVETVAFIRPDNGIVVVILNRKRRDVTVSVYDEKRGYINLEISKQSTNTIIYW